MGFGGCPFSQSHNFDANNPSRNVQQHVITKRCVTHSTLMPYFMLMYFVFCLAGRTTIVDTFDSSHTGILQKPTLYILKIRRSSNL